jgi:chromosome partitioning protein
LRAPVWFGQITHRTTYSLALAGGQGAREFDAESQAASEIARLFNSIERSVTRAIQGRERHAPQGGVTATSRRSGRKKAAQPSCAADDLGR